MKLAGALMQEERELREEKILQRKKAAKEYGLKEK